MDTVEREMQNKSRRLEAFHPAPARTHPDTVPMSIFMDTAVDPGAKGSLRASLMVLRCA